MSDLRRKLLEFVRARTTPYGLNVVDFGKVMGRGERGERGRGKGGGGEGEGE